MNNGLIDHSNALSHSFARGRAIIPVTYADTGNMDAFSRLRVSSAETLGEVQCQYNGEDLRLEAGSTNDGITPAFVANPRMMFLRIAAGAAGGTSFLQSFSYIPYQPGKSQLIAITGVMGAATDNAVKRYGYGDANNGIFYEQNGTSGLQFNRRTSTSGVIVNNTVTQANWNIDKFDGTGPSGVTLDPTKCFILMIDLQFLGMGRVRIGFDVDGVLYYAHEFLNANVLTVPYMQTASLPVMIEIRAGVGLAVEANCYFKCAQVASEGGWESSLGRDFASEGTATATAAGNIHILSLQPRTTFNGLTNRGIPVLEGIELLAGGNPIRWDLYIGVNFGATPPAYANVNTTYSFMNAGTGGTVVDLLSAIRIQSGYVGSTSPATRGAHAADLAMSYPITLNRAGAVRPLGTLSLLLTSFGGNSDCRAVLNWREIR